MGKISEIGFYGILTKPVVGYSQLATTMVNKGVKIIQLRMKNVPRDEILATAKELRAIIPSSVYFIVNDDAHIANEVKADGVHLGQADMSYSDARQIVGPDAIIGLSTHNPVQTQNACGLSPDYIGIGPVYVTPTKKFPDPVLGIEGMKAMLKVATVPAVCLGGIDHSNINAVLGGGAKNICAVRCINASLTPEIELDKMIAQIENNR